MGSAASASLADEFDPVKPVEPTSPKSVEAHGMVSSLLNIHGITTREQLLILDAHRMVMKKHNVRGSKLLRAMRIKMKELKAKEDAKKPKKLGMADIVIKAQARVHDLLEASNRRQHAKQQSAPVHFVLALKRSKRSTLVKNAVLNDLMKHGGSDTLEILHVHADRRENSTETKSIIPRRRIGDGTVTLRPTAMKTLEVTDFFKQNTEVELMTHEKMPKFTMNWVAKTPDTTVESTLGVAVMSI